MTHNFHTLLLVLFFALNSQAQTEAFKSNGKWGISEKGTVIVPAQYDTAFNFDPGARVCLVCYRKTSVSGNPSFRIKSQVYTCNYLDRNKRRLSIRIPGNDTCSIFSLGRQTVKQFSHAGDIIVVAAGGNRFLVDKQFRQLSFEPYHEINATEVPGFFVAETVTEAETTLSGLITPSGQTLVPHAYSSIRLNPFDSLIIACSAGLPSGEDGVYNYQGEKVHSSHRHIAAVSRNFLVYGIFEPEEYYILHKLADGSERKLKADEIRSLPGEALELRIGHNYFVYDLNTNEKKQLKKR